MTPARRILPLLAAATAAVASGLLLGLGNAPAQEDPPPVGREEAGAPAATTTGAGRRAWRVTRQVVLHAVVPVSGSGIFRVAAGSSAATGDRPRTYSVEVEREVGLRPAEVAGVVERTLAHPLGWRMAGHAFRRVPSSPSVRFLVATPATTDRLCAPLRTHGRLSCRNGPLVVINADRWVHGARSYGVDLRAYRRYLVNHEMGHALGYGHTSCPRPGAAAPVMLQQTLSLQGCRPNPWPGRAAPSR